MGIDFAKIKNLREKLGLSLGQAAVAAGIKSRQAWFNVECGKRSPRIETLEKIARALGVDAADLLVKAKGKK